jgi:hypothetical protein
MTKHYLLTYIVFNIPLILGKRGNVWTCVICNEKQSIIKVFYTLIRLRNVDMMQAMNRQEGEEQFNDACD